MRNRLFGFTAAVTALAALSGCAAPEPEPEALTITEAGSRYLDAVCPVNAAWDEVDVEVDRLRIAISRGDSVDTAGYVDALAGMELASRAAVETLDDPLVAWPAEAEAAVAEVGDSLRADARHAEEAAELAAAAAVAHRWPDVSNIADAALRARVALGLPEDPAGACAEHRVTPERPAADGPATSPAPTR